MDHQLTHLDIRLDAVSGDMSLDCHDPMFVRAEHLILHLDLQRLSAVVDGMLADLGIISDDMMEVIQGRSQIMLHADHFAGGHVTRRVPMVTRV
jgi:hypothetical protein